MLAAYEKLQWKLGWHVLSQSSQQINTPIINITYINMNSKLMHLFYPQCQDENSKDKRQGAMYQECVLLGDEWRQHLKSAPNPGILAVTNINGNSKGNETIASSYWTGALFLL